MKAKIIILTIAALLVATAYAEPGRRFVERSSTDSEQDLERVSIRGVVKDIEGQRAMVKTESGEQVTVHLGPRWYWQDKGYSLRSGLEVEVAGWGELYGEDGGYMFAASIHGDGFHFEIADSEGYPRWGGYWDEPCRPCPRRYYGYYDMYYYMPPPRCWDGPRPYWGPRWDRWHDGPRHHGWHRPHRPGPDRPPAPHPPPRQRRGRCY